MTTKFRGLLTLLLAFVVQLSFAQQKTISGTVTDDINLPLPGVNIIIKGTAAGTQSDFDGNYSINVEVGQTLVFSYVGFATQEVPITQATTTLNLQMQPDSILDEVIVTAYGRTTTRNELTSSVVTVRSEDITKAPFSSAEGALQGRVSGLQMNTTSGTPGSTAQIRIRGIQSINASNEPLYVIDGVPVQNTNVSGSANISSLNPLSTIDPNIIESITVLKDASAVAPYGAAGSNGVILITTKTAQKGRTSYSFNATTGIVNNARKGLQPLSGAQKQELMESAIWNSFGTSGSGIISSREEALQYMLDRPNQYGAFIHWNDNGRLDHNWYNEVRNKDALSQDYSFSVSHGVENTSIFASLGYFKQESTVIASEFDRISGTFKFDTKLGNKINLGFSSIISHANQDATLEQGAFFSNPNLSKYFLSPWLNPYDENGNPNITSTFTGFTTLHNSLYTARESSRNNAITRAVPSLRLSYDLTKDITLSSTFTIDYSQSYYKTYMNRIHGDGVGLGGYVEESMLRRFNYTSLNTIDYRFQLGDTHNFHVTGISEYVKFNTNYLYGFGAGLANDILQNISNTTTDFDAFSSFSDQTQLRYAALLNYSFDRRYILNASYAYQGDSRFDEESRFGSFYSVGLGWNIHNESFMFDSRMFNELRLRVGYGTTGNSGINRNTYQAQAGIGQYNNGAAISISGYGSTAGWETGEKKDIGLDFSMFDRRVRGTLGYYNNVSKDLLFNAQLPISSSFIPGRAIQNLGDITNKGFEVELSVDVIRTNDFNWNISGNYATVDNVVSYLPEDLTETTATRVIEEGYKVFEWYLREWAGVDPETGEALWYTNGAGSPTTNVYAEAEQVYQGKNALPTYSGGISTRFDYKNFFLEGTLYFAGGHKVYEDWAGYTQTSDAGRILGFNATTVLYDGVWQNPGDNATHPKIHFSDPNSVNASLASTRWLYDGDYMRLRDVAFGYNFNPEVVRHLGLTGLSMAIRGSNLLTWVKDDRLKWDPEVRTDGFTNLTTPPIKTVMFQVNVNF